MKKLQNNFTTPEQSKRLMEIGVPADSADCYYNMVRIVESSIINVRTSFQKSMSNFWKEHYPCWSVGRLIEIYLLCHANDYIYEFYAEEKPIDTIVSSIEYAIQEQDFDFSQLED